MLGPIRKALLPGVFVAALAAALPAVGADAYRSSLDAGIPHHAAILDTLARIEKDPSDAQLYNDLGCLVAWDGFWRDALRSFDKASELAPKDTRPWFNGGLVEALRGNWRGARSRFRKAVKVDPGNWPGWWMLGLSEESLGNRNAAVAAYSRSLRVDTSLFDPKVNPFAVASRLKSSALLETYDRRRVDAALPFANQLSQPSRVAAFFQARPRTPAGTVEIEEPPRTGPVVTTVPPPSTPRAVTAAPAPASLESGSRRRRAYAARESNERELPYEVSPAAAQPPEEEEKPAPGRHTAGAGSGAPGATDPPPPANAEPPRRVPGPGGPPGPPDGE
ncbi:MAG: tetratricopeptide repeat protein [Thermoanaerobaculia bacterium]|nr:tetratricopeptide repeat protein [Thermoanaerobaculia bacterium]